MTVVGTLWACGMGTHYGGGIAAGRPGSTVGKAMPVTPSVLMQRTWE